MRYLTLTLLMLLSISSLRAEIRIEKWKVLELSFTGPESSNPFTDITFACRFIKNSDTIVVTGFYDGNGIYKIRFMPHEEGKWTYITISNTKTLHRKKGAFTCITAGEKNHGPVVARDTFHFGYADGKRYYPFGTTSYAWIHQGDSLAAITLTTLAKGYFNKIRFCIFPKSYDWNHNEPLLYPFEGKPPTNWDYTRFNPAYFRSIEKRIAQLDSLGIEADLIVFHPYDRWNFSKMDRKTDDLYINYIIARFAAYKNVWWSMANEYDYMHNKTKEDWQHYLEVFSAGDPYHRLRGIHNGPVIYDATNPLITHASVQDEHTANARNLRIKFKKPVIYDECRYEGNIFWTWGNLTPQAMVDKFWKGVTSGGYVCHGETYLMEEPLQSNEKSDDILWWSKGGVLHGESPQRIQFLKQITEAAPGDLTPESITATWLGYSAVTYRNEYYLLYFGQDQPRGGIITLPADSNYKIEVIDAWNMSITSLPGVYKGKCLVELPAKPYTALRITKQ